MNRIFKLMPLLCLLLAGPRLHAQGDPQEMRLEVLGKTLDSLSRIIPGLNNRADLALTNVLLHDYVRSLGKVHKVNVFIDDTPGRVVTNNLTDESVKSIFLFICKKFDYTIETTGTILNFIPWTPLSPPPAAKPAKLIQIAYEDSLIWFDLKEDTLDAVIRKISRMTGKTIIVAPVHNNTLISGYIPPSEFDSGFENLMFMNGFTVAKHRKGFYMLDKPAAAPSGATSGRTPSGTSAGTRTPGISDYALEIGRDTSGQALIFLRADNTPIDQVLHDLFDALEMEYVLFDQIQGNTTVNVEGADLDEVLKNMLRGTDFTWRSDGEVYLVGKRDMEGLRQVRIVKLKYRPSEKVIELIPAKMKEGVELKEYVELNRIIVSGEAEQVKEVEDFILEIDRPVPMVKIEMVVVDVDFNRLMRTGVKAGLYQPGDSVGAIKSILPGINYTLDGSEVNNVLANSGIPALMNVGTLKSNFYLQLQAEETRGNLRVVTRPVISTLNGNTASITIGQTNYYLLQSQIFNNSAVNNINTVAQNFHEIQINTTISVKPSISYDGMVTMDLKPNFTVPGTQVDKSIPPSILTRQFESIIRVKDGETVVLGGLSRESNGSTVDGLPWISRVPILKFFFSNSTQTKTRNSLIIYITPTIYYN